MEIILKNGEKINLEWNPIVIEYLEDYENENGKGLNQLIADLKRENTPFKVFNFIIYCFLNAVYPRELGYREAVSLVNPADLNKIIDFVVASINGFADSKENKKTIKIPSKHRR